MRIAREEIFGPVLSILTYKDEEEAIRMANDTVYGLAAYVQSSDLDARTPGGGAHARRERPHQLPGMGFGAAPFGGYKQSGNGREYADFGLEEFLETKAVIGYAAA